MAQQEAGTQLLLEKQLGEHTRLMRDKTSSHHRLKVVRQLKLDGMTDDEKTELIEEIKLQRDRVNHRYCMRISEVICEREIVNVITEYCEGGTLKALLARACGFEEVLNEIEVMDWLVQMLLALQHIHQQGVPHLNLSTRNIYLKNSCVKLTESRQLKNLYRRTRLGGHQAAATDDEKDDTAIYRSREEVMSGDTSTKSDIWSVGCIIFEMCAQRPLFTGSTREQLNRSISEQQLPQFPDMFSVDLNLVWERLLERDVDSRPSATEALDLPFIAAHLKDMEASLGDDRCAGSDESLHQPPYHCHADTKDRGMDNHALDNEEDEDATSEYAPDEDGYVDLGLNDEETQTLFNLS